MSEKVVNSIAPSPSACAECHRPLPDMCYTCNICEKKVELCSEECAIKHVRAKHITPPPPLTPWNCVVCGRPPAGTCWFQNPPCSAPLCAREDCHKEHGDKHTDSRSEEEKDQDRIKTIMEELDRDN